MRFTFIHSADLHIDSPLASLGVKDPSVAARFSMAGRKAFERLIDATIENKAAFLIIAGDVFDGDWKDVTTGLFFARALGRLHRAGIPTVMIKGNHDADSIMSRSLNYPDSVRLLASDKAETVNFSETRVALHGRSFGGRRVPDDFVGSYPARREGWLNIGVLHTGLDGVHGHESYAPCSVDDLRRFGYDYWALGHIHAAEVVSRDPWIVYPGNLQGRSVRETGPKGAMRVTVDDGHIVEVEPIVLDHARWAHETIDASNCAHDSDALALISSELTRLHQQSDGRPLAVRFTLSGTTHAHSHLLTKRETILEEARALGFQVAEDCWVEQVRLQTDAPRRASPRSDQPDALDLEALIESAADDPGFAEIVSEIMASIAEKLPRELRTEVRFDDPDAVTKVTAIARDHLNGALSGEMAS